MRIFAALFLLFTILPFSVHAEETPATTKIPAGYFVAVSGDVFITNADEDLPVEAEDPIFENDVVVTNSGARVLIRFKDETELVLGGDASLEINSYIFNPDDAPNNEGDFLLKGPFAWMSGLLPKGNKNVTLNTEMGSIGIRGTTVWGGTLEDKFGVFVFDGKVFFTNKTGRVSIENGEGVFVEAENTALEVKKWGDPKIQAAVKTVSFPEGVVSTDKYDNAFTVKPKAPKPDPSSFEDDAEIDSEDDAPETLEKPDVNGND